MSANHFTSRDHESLPPGWRWARLGDLALIGTTNGVFKRREQFGHGAPLVNVSDLFKSIEIDLNTVERVEASEKELRHYSVEPGDLFFCRSSIKREGVGWCAYVREVKEPAVFDSHIMRVRLDPQKAFFEYVAHYWRLPELREVIGSSRTATMTTMNQGDLAQISVPLPSLPEHRRASERGDGASCTRPHRRANTTRHNQRNARRLFADGV